MTPEDLRNKFEEETGTPWQNSQDEPDIDYVMWLETKVISYEIINTTPNDFSLNDISQKEKQDLEVARQAWKANNKLSAMSIVRSIFPILNVFGAKAYCEKHFSE